MRLEILRVPDCPHWPVLRERLTDALADARADVTLVERVIEDADEATAAGMTGSPTMLIDGVDPFAEPGLVPSLSCRLYPDADGGVSGAPAVLALRRVLVGGWRARTIPADPAERALHRTILEAFAVDGVAPSLSALEQTAAPFGLPAAEVLNRLHEQDIIRLDPAGAIRAAYPFSGVPTRHRVRLAGGPSVDAMCVIDALGIPAMLDTDAVVSTVAPGTGRPVTVTFTGGRARWEPATSMVFVGALPGAGPSVDTCCDFLNAFPDAASGQEWAAAHPEVPGDLLDGAAAEQLGRRIFGHLLGYSQESTE